MKVLTKVLQRLRGPRTVAELTDAVEGMFGSVEVIARAPHVDVAPLGFGLAQPMVEGAPIHVDTAAIPLNFKMTGASEAALVKAAWSYVRSKGGPDKGRKLLWRIRPKLESYAEFESNTRGYLLRLRGWAVVS